MTAAASASNYVYVGGAEPKHGKSHVPANTSCPRRAERWPGVRRRLSQMVIAARRELAPGFIEALSGRAQGGGDESRALPAGMHRLAGLAPLPVGHTGPSSRSVGDGLNDLSRDNNPSLLCKASRQALARNEYPIARELLRAAVDTDSTRSSLIGVGAARDDGFGGLLRLAQIGKRLPVGMRKAPFIPPLRIRGRDSRRPRPACATRKSCRPRIV